MKQPTTWKEYVYLYYMMARTKTEIWLDEILVFFKVMVFFFSNYKYHRAVYDDAMEKNSRIKPVVEYLEMTVGKKPREEKLAKWEGLEDSLVKHRGRVDYNDPKFFELKAAAQKAFEAEDPFKGI